MDADILQVYKRLAGRYDDANLSTWYGFIPFTKRYSFVTHSDSPLNNVDLLGSNFSEEPKAVLRGSFPDMCTAELTTFLKETNTHGN